MAAEKMVVIPLRVLLTLHTAGYYAQFWLYVQEGLNHREAYEKLEDELELYELPKRYDSYESFRNAKSHFARMSKKGIDFW